MDKNTNYIAGIGGAGMGKSFIVQRAGNLAGGFVMKLAPTGMASSLIRGTTIHTGLGIKVPTIKTDIAASAKRLSSVLKKRKVELVIIDEISMVSSR